MTVQESRRIKQPSQASVLDDFWILQGLGPVPGGTFVAPLPPDEPAADRKADGKELEVLGHAVYANG